MLRPYPQPSTRHRCLPNNRIDQRCRIKPHRVRRRQSRFLPRACNRLPRRALVHVVRVETDPDHLRRMYRLRRTLVDLDHLDIRWDLHPRLAAVIVADVIAGRLMTENQRVGTGAVQQAERDAGVSWVNQAALSFQEHDVVVLRALEDQLLRGAGDEVRYDRIHRDPPALDEDPGLPRRHEARAMAALHQRIAELQLRGHLADVAIGSHREHDQRVNFGGAAVGAMPIITAVAPLPCARPRSKSPTTGMVPPNPSTSCAVFPACLRSNTATIRSGK